MRDRSRFLLGPTLLSLALAQGCGGADLGDCPSNSEATQAEGSTALKENCLSCHSTSSTNRNGAPSDKNMDDLAYVREDAEEIYGEVEGGDMPPSGKLPAATIEAIRVYLACGAK